MDGWAVELAHSMIFVLHKSSCSWNLNKIHNTSSGGTIMTKLAVSALEEQWANLEQLHSENIQFWASADIQAGSWFLIISLFLKCVQQSLELIKNCLCSSTAKLYQTPV